MSATKVVDNNRRTHAVKVLAEKSKKLAESSGDREQAKELEKVDPHLGIPNLQDQYQLIKNDVLKLRKDLGLGYDMLKIWLRTHFNLKTALRLNR